ncbi:MAG: FAD-binding oxidoreductase [Tatlockia sp.]|nr:FAD-binding oxidoreductase [Tatlockia sp.]
MLQTQWSTHQIKQCKKETGQAMLSDEHSLVSYSQDFGKIAQSKPAAVCIPQTSEQIQAILSYANQNHLALTIRGKGLSQSGQALPIKDGLILHLQQLNSVLDKEDEAIWVEANSSWAELIETSLKTEQIPLVLPYNCNLSIGGVISAAGIGASSFKFGPVSAHVKALEVVLANGEVTQVDEKSQLFHACLSGQGRFGVITKACIKLRRCAKQVKTFFLVYLEKDQWLHDLNGFKTNADYIEAYCSPSPQGAKLVAGKRIPFAQWLFSIHVSIEYDNSPPKIVDLLKTKPWQIIHQQDETIHSYLLRHNSRFEAMKLTGQWDLLHPWYECFMSKQLLIANLDEVLAELPIYYASLLHVIPIAHTQQTGFLMFPEANEVYGLMILNPGINPALLSSCLEVIKALDAKFLKQGGKRYLSGYIGSNLDTSYWQNHFGALYADWIGLKEKYDAQHTLSSFLFFPG